MQEYDREITDLKRQEYDERSRLEHLEFLIKIYDKKKLCQKLIHHLFNRKLI